jgi:hypothetical protein
MEDHEAARAHPSCGLVEAKRWWKENEETNGGGGGFGRVRGKENRAQRPAAAWERRRGALVGRCPAPCRSRGVGSARGLRASAWAGRGKE